MTGSTVTLSIPMGYYIHTASLAWPPREESLADIWLSWIPGWSMLSDWPGGTLFWLVLAALAACVVAMAVAWLVELNDRMGGRSVWLWGTVAEKHFTPESTSASTGVGPVLGGNGGVAVTSSTHHHPAGYTLLVDIPGWDSYVELEVDPKDYRRAKEGHDIRVLYTHGLSGRFYGPLGYMLEMRPRA